MIGLRGKLASVCLHQNKGALLGKSGGAKKSRKRVYRGHVRVTGILNIAAVGISRGVLSVEFCLISEVAE